MNLVLFEADEISKPLPLTDRRAIHILEVLRRRPGDSFDAGLIDGPRGKATLQTMAEGALNFSLEWTSDVAAPEPITVLVGLPRPQTARDILRDATTLGVGALHFVRTDKGDPNYASSTLWSSGEWRRHVIAGAEQAFHTRLPNVSHGRKLADELSALPRSTTRLALDNYESTGALSQISALTAPATLAIGSERGWSEPERALLRSNGFEFVNLGPRVLRTETACIAALSFVRAKLGLM